MNVREWPLIAFTLLAQTGVGFFLFFALPAAFAKRKLDGPETRWLLVKAILLAFFLLAAAAALSFFHLGNPQNAYRALNNLRHSWLSREIFFELLLMACLLFLAGLEWGKRGGTDAVLGLYLLAALSGAALIWSMSNIYRLESVPPWNNVMTPFSFFMTALMLGSLGSAAWPAFASLKKGVDSLSFFPGIAGPTALALVVINLAALILFDPNFGLWKTWVSNLAREHPSAIKALFVMRLAFLVLAGLFIVLSLAGNRSPSARSPFWHPAFWAFVLAFFSEILGRTLFFTLFRKAGL